MSDYLDTPDEPTELTPEEREQVLAWTGTKSYADIRPIGGKIIITSTPDGFPSGKGVIDWLKLFYENVGNLGKPTNIGPKEDGTVEA